jgi:chemotaxis protein methyltransferase CheR
MINRPQIDFTNGDLTTTERQLLPLTDFEYKLIRDLVYERFGISLGESKKSLIVGRLNKVLKDHGLASFKEYYDFVVADSSGKALEMLIDRISTNHTFFYREHDHFEFFLDTVLPAMKSQQQAWKNMRVWCPGCSSGEEPYTLALLLMEFFGRDLPSWDVGVLATDISSRVLQKAAAGLYESESVERLPAAWSKKYFHRLPEGRCSVNDPVKKLVTYRRLNLMRQDYPFRGKFSVIFCRNVMIYFDQPTRNALVHRFHRYMEPGGYLFIGHSETLGRGDTYFRNIRPAVYQKV